MIAEEDIPPAASFLRSCLMIKPNDKTSAGEIVNRSWVLTLYSAVGKSDIAKSLVILKNKFYSFHCGFWISLKSMNSLHRKKHLFQGYRTIVGSRQEGNFVLGY